METGLLLIKLSSVIYILLGSVHILLTLFTSSFEPRDSDVLALINATSPNISTQTTLWAGGVGFHFSHSLGLIIFGVLYFSLVQEAPFLIYESLVFSYALFVIPSIYLFLSLRYWFVVPSIGFVVSGLGYVMGSQFLGG